eukprot:RCo052742
MGCTQSSAAVVAPVVVTAVPTQNGRRASAPTSVHHAIHALTAFVEDEAIERQQQRSKQPIKELGTLMQAMARAENRIQQLSLRCSNSRFADGVTHPAKPEARRLATLQPASRPLRDLLCSLPGHSRSEIEAMFAALDQHLEAHPRPEGFTEDDCLAVWAYAYELPTPPQIYASLTAAQRAAVSEPEALDSWSDYLFYLTTALHKLPSRKGTVFRGIPIQVDTREYGGGTFVLWPAFSSTSRNSTVAKEFFLQQGRGVMFALEVCEAYDISALSPFPSEEEWLIPPNAVFSVSVVFPDSLRGIMRIPDGSQLIQLTQLEKGEADEVCFHSKRYKELWDIKNGRYVEFVVKTVNEVARLYPDSWVHLLWQCILFGYRGDCETAFSLALQASYRIRYLYATIFILMAQQLYDRGMVTESLYYASRAFELDPRSPVTLGLYFCYARAAGKAYAELAQKLLESFDALGEEDVHSLRISALSSDREGLRLALERVRRQPPSNPNPKE